MIKNKQYIAFVALALIFSPVISQAQSTAAKPAAAKPAAPANKQPDLTQGIDQMFAAMDVDKNKQLSFEEFKNGVVAQRRQMMIIERLQQNFKAADKNANSTLEIAEFNALPGLQAMPAPKPAFASFDVNKDQKMDFREYVEFIGKMSTQAAAQPKK
jgi:Ca2+-binding EF-hand superfamily protein